MLEPTAKDIARFWSKVQKTDDCWLWTGFKRSGYGLMHIERNRKRSTWSAHRLSFYIHHGYIDDELSVLHSCDVPPCVNPEHLRLGTRADNNLDKNIKNRHGYRITNEQVIDIRSRPLTNTMCRDLAAEFDISVQAVKRILSGESYSWLPGEVEIPPQFTSYSLSPEDVEDIVKRASTGKWGIQTRLAEEYGVHKTTISHIVKGRLKYTQPVQAE